MEITYGKDTPEKQRARIKAMELAMKCMSDISVPGKYLVNDLPWLKYVPAWLPGTSFHAVAQEGKKHVETAISVPFQEIKAAVVSQRSYSL